MGLNRTQYLAIIVSILATLLLWLGCDTKTPDQKKAVADRALNMEVTSAQNILLEAKKQLSRDQLPIIDALNVELDNATDDLAKAEVYKRMSSIWYDFGHPILAGHYADKVAQAINSENAWSIAGTTYLLGIKNTADKKLRDYASSKAHTAFDNAISINPENVDHKINKALCLVENPVTNPMEGIMMLLDLNKEFPREVKVLQQLARLGIKTNQWDKAIERLTTALEVDPDNINTHCLLVEAYLGKGDTAAADKHKQRCK